MDCFIILNYFLKTDSQERNYWVRVWTFIWFLWLFGLSFKLGNQTLYHSALGRGSNSSDQTIGRALFQDDNNLMNISLGVMFKHTGGDGMCFGNVILRTTCFHLYF